MSLTIKNLSKSYGNRTLFSDFNYVFPNHGFVFVVGESGCGKSTLLNCLSGIDLEFNGTIFFNDIKFTQSNILELRQKYFTYIFQSFNLFENDTVINNLLLILDYKKYSKEEKNELINDALKKVEMSDYKNCIVKNLSGGEKQRICIARSLLMDSEIIFADEPTGSLDSANSKNIFDILKEISKEKLIISVTHDKDSAFLYGDIILKVDNSKINEIKKKKIKKINKISFKNDYKIDYKISLKFIFDHIKNEFKNKKVRNLIANFLFSFSLIVFGLSLLLNFTFQDILVSSFDSLLGNESLVLRKKEDINLKEYYGATYEEVECIKDKYQDEIEYIGVNYIVDFENFFIDSNDLYNVSKNPISKIEGFTIRNFNEFKYIKDLTTLNTFTGITNLENDEIVLGINFPTLKRLCQDLYIEKSYDSLGDYLKNNKVLVSLYLKNDEWNYSDEQVFILKGIIQDVRPQVYHTNPLFNQYLFEDCMRFPSSLNINQEFEIPWIMKKVYYVSLINHQFIFLDKIFNDKNLNYYLFENDNINYSPLNYSNNSKKQYVFYVSLNKFDIDILSNIKDYITAKNFYYSTNGGYINYGNSLFSGFSSPIFAGNNKEIVENFVDNYLDVDIQERENISIDKNISYGNSLSLDSENLKFTTLFNGLIEGKEPTKLNEIGISSYLSNKLNLKVNNDIYLCLVNPDYYKNSKESTFKTIKLKVSGIYKNNLSLLYQNPMFSINLFRDLFKISSFNLLINSIVIESDKKIDSKYIENLNKLLKDYEFLNVLSDVKENIDNTLNILIVILLLISIFVMIFAIIILITVNLINFEESIKQINIFKLLGFSNKEINKVFFISNIKMILISFLEAIISLILLSFLLSIILKNQLNTLMIYSFPSIPILFMFLLFVLLIVLTYPFLISSIKKIKINMHIN